MSVFNILRGDVEAMRGPRGRCGFSRQFTKAGPGRRHAEGGARTRILRKLGRWRRRLAPVSGPGSMLEYDEAMRRWLSAPYDHPKPSRRTRKGDGALVFC